MGKEEVYSKKEASNCRGPMSLKKVCGKNRLIIGLETTTPMDMEFHHLLPSLHSIWGVNAYERNTALGFAKPQKLSQADLLCFLAKGKDKRQCYNPDLEIHFIRQTQQRVLPAPVTDSCYLLLGVQGPVNHPFPARKPGSKEHSVLYQKAPSPE